MLEIKETNIDEIFKIRKNVSEFFETTCEKSIFENRYKDKNNLLLTAYLEKTL